MIKQIFGKVDTQNVAFTHNDTTWVASVPADKTAYCLEIWAEDFAGNVSYMSTILITYDLEKLCFKFEIVDVGASWSTKDVVALFQSSDITSNISADDINLTLGTNDVQIEILKKECCQ